jgi:predicted phage-related endonuclease
MTQGTAEWFAARRGIPTGSGLRNIITPTGRAVTGAARDRYMRELLYERLTGQTFPHCETYAMRRGSELEAEARAAFVFETGLDVTAAGFIRHPEIDCGVSPDGLIGDDSGLEIKTAMPDNYMAFLVAGKVPDDHLVQIQACMWVTGRESWHYWLFDPDLPCMHILVEASDVFRVALDFHVRQFLKELNALENEIKTRYDCAAIRESDI